MHADWTKIRDRVKLLNSETTPFIYGRCLQLVADRSNFYRGKGRRNRVADYLRQRTPEQIIAEACSMIQKYNIPDFQQHPAALLPDDDDMIYFGRCLQFLLDTDRKKYILSDLITKSFSEIKKLAHQVKYEILERAAKKQEQCDSDCECECDFLSKGQDCITLYGEKRCECRWHPGAINVSYLSHLDSW